MELSLYAVTVDCADPQALAQFWSAAAGFELAHDFGDFVILRPSTGTGPHLGLQRVRSPTPGKNRIHLDFSADDRAAEVARLVDLGAGIVGEHAAEDDPSVTWVVLTDPEGNQFCVG